MRDEFGIGFGLQLMTACEKLPAQVEIIFYNAVVNHRDRAGLMRMRVFVRGASVSRPSRVADSDVAFQRITVEQFAELVELPFRAANFELAVLMKRRDAGGIVAAIFEAAKTGDQNRARL